MFFYVELEKVISKMTKIQVFYCAIKMSSPIQYNLKIQYTGTSYHKVSTRLASISFYSEYTLLWSHKWKIISGISFSSAHILGEAMERVYGGHLCYGPPIEQGFYYDMYSEDHNVSDNDFKVTGAS